MNNYQYTVFSGKKQIISTKSDIDFNPDGYLRFDGTVVAKPSAKTIQLVTDRQMEWFGEGC